MEHIELVTTPPPPRSSVIFEEEPGNIVARRIIPQLQEESEIRYAEWKWFRT